MILTIELVAKNSSERWSESSRDVKNDFSGIYGLATSLAQSASDCAGGSPQLPGRCLMESGFHTLCGSALKGGGFPLQSEADCAKEVTRP